MSHSKLVECEFLIPLHRDHEISDALAHSLDTWRWLEEELLLNFDGWTQAPGKYRGAWKSAASQLESRDESRKYVVAISRREVAALREILATACQIFEQQCIYLSIAGKVEFIKP